jgi:hypothetical protein
MSAVDSAWLASVRPPSNTHVAFRFASDVAGTRRCCRNGAIEAPAADRKNATATIRRFLPFF